MRQSLSHVLLDIEGTTCPVSFVSDTLFPYAATHLGSFLEAHGDEEEVGALVEQVEQAWQRDPDPAARELRQSAEEKTGAPRVLPYLLWLIGQDRKLTPLKDLQGRVWQAGYRSGELQGPLYEDVAPALRRWRADGLGLAVYSSGSVAAQQLIYGHSTAGDLCPLFSHWFDTRIGSKLEPESYACIVRQLETEAGRVLFISDSVQELQAANQAGLATLLCARDADGTCTDDWSAAAVIRSFDDVTLRP
ncbi:MAG: acireductone synthase [Cyanobium sp.]